MASWFKWGTPSSQPPISGADGSSDGNIEHFVDHQNAAELSKLWRIFVDRMDEDDAGENLRSFVVKYDPNFLAPGSADTNYEIPLSKLPSIPNVSKIVVESALLRLNMAKRGSRELLYSLYDDEDLIDCCEVFEYSQINSVLLDRSFLIDEVYLMFMLTSKQENRSELASLGAIGSLFQVIKFSALRGFDPTVESDVTESLMVGILYCYSALNHLLAESDVQVDGSSNAFAPEKLKEQLRADTMITVCDQIRHMRIRPTSPKEFLVYVATFKFVEKLLRADVSFKEQFLDSKILQELLNFLGWPEAISPAWSFESSKSMFLFQHSCFRVLAEAFGHVQTLHRWSSLGGFQKVMDFILWTCSEFALATIPSNESMVIQHEKRQRVMSLSQPELSSPLPRRHANSVIRPTQIEMPAQWNACNPYLDSITMTLLKMAMVPTVAVSGAGVRASSTGPFVDTKIANKTVLLVLMDLFNEDIRQTKNNSHARNIIKRFPELQLCIIYLLCLVVESKPSTVSLFSECGIWDTLSDSFFTQIRASQATAEPAAENFTSPEATQASQYLTDSLIRYIFGAVEFMATVDKADNSHEIQFLYDLIDGYGSITQHATGSILRILETCPNVTAASLIAIGALHHFPKLILDATKAIQKSGPNGSTGDIEVVRSVLARTISLIVNNPLSIPTIISDSSIIDTMFELIADKSISGFALSQLVSILKSDPKSIQEHPEVYFKMYEKYLDTLLKPELSHAEASVELLLLKGIVSIVDLKDNKEQQNMFREAGAFIKVTSLIHITPNSRETLPDICLAVLKALSALMAGNTENKGHFAEHIGYDQLKELILRAFNKQLSKKLLHSLFDLLLDSNRPTVMIDTKIGELGQEVEEGDLSVVKNPNIATLLLKLVPFFGEAEQNTLFDHLIQLVRGSSVTRSKFSSENMLYQLLGMITAHFSAPELSDRLFTLITMLGEHNITVRDLNRLISLMKPLAGDYRVRIVLYERIASRRGASHMHFQPPWISNVLDVVEKLAESPQSRFPVYFDFDGNKSSLVLPALPRWPLLSGNFSLTTRLSVESFIDPHGIPNYLPRLFSFLDAEGHGMEVFFSNGILNFQTLVPGRKGERKAFNDFTFSTKTWYFVAVTYSITGIIGKAAEVKLYVDGVLRGREVLKQPMIFTNLVHTRVGSNAAEAIVADSGASLRENALFGQMADIVFYDNELELAQLEDIRKGVKGSTPEPVPRGEWANVFDGPSSSQARVVMSYSPKATTSIHAASSGSLLTSTPPEGATAVCFDGSPHARDAMLLNGLNVVHRRHIKEIFGCISGSITAFFPLIQLLDKIEKPAGAPPSAPLLAANSPSKFAQRARARGSIPFRELKRLSSSAEMQDIDDIAQLPVEDTDDTDPVAMQFAAPRLAEQIFRVLCRMLSGSKELQYDMKCSNGLQTISFLLLRVSPHNLSVSLIDTLVSLFDSHTLPEWIEDELILHVLLDFHLWIYSRFHVQKHLLQKALPRIVKLKPYLRERFGMLVSRLLESIRTFYWSVASPDVMAIDPIVHPITKLCIAQRPSHIHLAHLRSFFMDLLEDIVTPEITLEETKELIFFLSDCKDADACVDVLKFVSKLIQVDKVLITHIKTIGVEYLVALLDHKSSRVRTHVTSLLNAIWHRRAPAMQLPEPEQLLPVVQGYLEEYKIDQRVYNALFAMTVGWLKPVKGWDTSRRIDVDDSTELQVPSVLPVLFKLCRDAGVSMIQQLLQDLYLLISCRDDNKETLLATFGWQLWLLESLDVGDDPTSRRVVFEMALNIFKVTLMHKMQSKNGWNYIYEMDCFVKLASDNRVKGAHEFFLQFIRLITRMMRKELHDLRNNLFADSEQLFFLRGIASKSSCVLDNFIHLVFFTLEFIYHAELPSKEPRSDSTIAPLQVLDTEIAHDVFDIAHFLEGIDLAQSLAVTANCVLSFKKIYFKAAGQLPLVYKLVATEWYLGRSIDRIKRMNTILLAHLFRKGTKMEEVHYVLFHGFSALVQSSKDLDWAKQLQEIILSFVYQVFRNYKAHFYVLKKFDQTQLEFFEGLKENVTAVDITSQLIKEVMAVLRTKLGASEKDELESCESVFRQQQKSFKVVFGKWVKAKEMDAAAIKKTRDAITAVKAAHFTRVAPRGISHDVLTEKYAKIAWEWRKILRILKNERGPWGTRESTVHWKVDPMENFSRMRQKLRRNYYFNDHSDATRSSAVVARAPIDALSDSEPLSQSDDIARQRNLPSAIHVRKRPSDADAGRPDMSKLEIDDTAADIEAKEPALQAAERPSFSFPCELIRPMKVVKGVLEISQTQLRFKEVRGPGEDPERPLKDRIWPLDQIREVHLRRYLLVQSALEIFLTDRTNWFLNFNKKERDRIYNKIIRINPPRLIYADSSTAEAILRNSGLTRKWQMRQISNFDYLMQLNTIAGRTYNDLCQYPVFPWVLADYTSEKIDLSDPAIYRDLSKPVGALNPKRLQQFQERLSSWGDLSDEPPFLYGTHYSSAATVLYYLIRTEPFTSLAIKLQGGRFDVSDRLFYSIPQTFSICLTSTSDVKELVPEFFYDSDFLENTNAFDFGKRQNGEKIGDVILPAWAKSPEEFIRMNRLALESEYVSAHLHEWIDLIFGFKQRGDAAIEANNLFHYLTYEGEVELDAITDPIKRQATEMTIAEFGQTPSQLLTKPHPPRGALPAPQSDLPKSRTWPILTIPVSQGRIVWVGTRRQDIACLDQSGRIRFVQISFLAPETPTSPGRAAQLFRQASQTLTGGGNQNQMAIESQTREYSTFIANSEDAPARLTLPHLSQYSTFHLSRDGTVLVSAQNDDNYIKTTILDSSKQVQSIPAHRDVVTCLGLTEDGTTLITGSKDTTLLVWNTTYRSGSLYIDETPRRILNGHDDEVTCLAVNAELDICVSGSKDKSCIIYNLREGRYVRSIFRQKGQAAGYIDSIAISPVGYLILYSRIDLMFYLYTLNGKFIRTADAHEHPNVILTTRDGEFLISGGKKSTVLIRSIFELRVVERFTLSAPVSSLVLSSDEKYILVGQEDGNLAVLEVDFASLPKIGPAAKLRRQQTSIGV